MTVRVPITVRPASPGEYARVGELTVAAYRALPVDHLWGGYEEEILDTHGRAHTTEILVAVAGGHIVGAVTYVANSASEWSEATEPGEAQFRLLAVDPAARGQGAGLALVRACTDRAAAAGQPLLIHTTRWMETARRMYERVGFVRRPDRDVPYEAWHGDRELNLPSEWVGEPFLAYGLPPAP